MNILLSFYLLKGTEQTKEYWSGKAMKQASKDTMLHQREKLWQKLGELKQEIVKLRNISGQPLANHVQHNQDDQPSQDDQLSQDDQHNRESQL